MIRSSLVVLIVMIRKVRRALGLPVLDLSGDVGPLKRDVRAMEQPPKEEPRDKHTGQ